MLKLPMEDPEVNGYLNNGNTDMSVQLEMASTFDQTIEETENKNTQTAEKTKGFSLNTGMVSKYYLMAQYRSIFGFFAESERNSQ